MGKWGVISLPALLQRLAHYSRTPLHLAHQVCAPPLAHPTPAGQAAKQVSKLALQRVRELQSRVEDSRLEVASKVERIAALEAQVRSAGPCDAGLHVEVLMGGNAAGSGTNLHRF